MWRIIRNYFWEIKHYFISFCRQWDEMGKGKPFQEIARISYGDHPGNHISIIQVIFFQFPSFTALSMWKSLGLKGFVDLAHCDFFFQNESTFMLKESYCLKYLLSRNVTHVILDETCTLWSCLDSRHEIFSTINAENTHTKIIHCNHLDDNILEVLFKSNFFKFWIKCFTPVTVAHNSWNASAKCQLVLEGFSVQTTWTWNRVGSWNGY